MISAIVYNSKTGSCKRYAELLSARLHVPCKPLDGGYVRPEGQVIYVGWVMNGKVAGYPRAAEKLNVAAVVAVGMGAVSAEAVAKGRAANGIPEGVGFFLLQGGFHMDKLSAPMKLIMKVITKKIAKGYAGKSNLTPQEQALYRMASTGDGEPADWNVDEIVAWAEKQ